MRTTPGTNQKPLRIVMVDEELPFPPTSGKRLRTLNLTLRLAARHHITYVCHRNADAEEARQAAMFFADNGVTPIVVQRPVPRRSGAGFYLRLAANLLSPLPYTVASHTSEPMRQTLRNYGAANPADVWHCEWTPYAELVNSTATVPTLVVAHNVESVIWQRYRETERNLFKKWYIARQWHKFQRFERRALGAATRTVAVSDVDADRLRRDFGVSQIDVVENGVDTDYFRPIMARRDPTRLLFLGSLDWRPNLDGVIQLLDRVFPAVRAVEPRATLCLVGRNPPDWLRRRAAVVPGVELHGSVPDVRPYLAECGMMVVPLRIGGGSRLKILEALAAGVPVVSTAIGAEGLCLDADRHLTVVPDIENLAEPIISGIRNHSALMEQAVRGRAEVLRRYDWDQLAEKLERVWYACAGRASETRRAA